MLRRFDPNEATFDVLNAFAGFATTSGYLVDPDAGTIRLAASTYAYSVFEEEGSRYLQLDTYGSQERKILGKTSQSIQLDAKAAAALKSLIERVFPEI